MLLYMFLVTRVRAYDLLCLEIILNSNNTKYNFQCHDTSTDTNEHQSLEETHAWPADQNKNDPQHKHIHNLWIETVHDVLWWDLMNFDSDYVYDFHL